METAIIIALAAIALLSLLLASIYKNQRDEAWNANEDSQDEDADSILKQIHDLDHRYTSLEGAIYPAIERGRDLKEQVAHLAKVQMLILKDMGKEHQIQPAKDVLVTIGNLSDLNKSKGRSA